MKDDQRAMPLAVEISRAFRPVVWTLLVVLLLAIAHFGFTWYVDNRLDQLLDADRARTLSHDAVLDQETSIRSYLLTGDSAELEQYEQARERADAADPVLLRGTASDDGLGELLLASWNRRNEWSTEWAELVTAAEDPSEAAGDLALVAAGNRLFDNYREADAELAAALLDRMDSIRETDQTVFQAGLALSLVAVAIGLGATARQARRVRRNVDQPLRELVSVVKRVRRGDLSVRAVPAGPAELREIAEELGHTTSALADERTRADQRELELSRLADVAGRVLDFAQDFSSSLELERVVRAISRGALPLAGMSESRVWLVEHSEEAVALAHVERDDGAAPSAGPEHRRLGETLPGRAGQLGRALYEHDGTVDARLPDQVDGIALPMIAGGSTIGVLELRADAPMSLEEATHLLLEKVSTQAGIALEAARMHGRTRELVRRDDLTGLMNRRQMDEDLASELARFRRYGTPVAFAILDLDHFKNLNDTLGHQAGDDYLRAFAGLIGGAVRATDTVYRYGGEEFAVLLRESRATDADGFLQRVRSRLHELDGVAGTEKALTFSAGISQGSDTVQESDSLLRSADRALYEAKRSGRNRWVFAGERVLSLTEEVDKDPAFSSDRRRSRSRGPSPASA